MQIFSFRNAILCKSVNSFNECLDAVSATLARIEISYQVLIFYVPFSRASCVCPIIGNPGLPWMRLSKQYETSCTKIALFLVFMLRHKILKSKFNRPAKLLISLGVR